MCRSHILYIIIIIHVNLQWNHTLNTQFNIRLCAFHALHSLLLFCLLHFPLFSDSLDGTKNYATLAIPLLANWPLEWHKLNTDISSVSEMRRSVLHLATLFAFILFCFDFFSTNTQTLRIATQKIKYFSNRREWDFYVSITWQNHLQKKWFSEYFLTFFLLLRIIFVVIRNRIASTSKPGIAAKRNKPSLCACICVIICEQSNNNFFSIEHLNFSFWKWGAVSALLVHICIDMLIRIESFVFSIHKLVVSEMCNTL